jgi:membrane fusion protein, copper/silver efflux system
MTARFGVRTLLLAAAASALVAGGLGYGLGRHRPPPPRAAAPPAPAERKVLYWYDPMVPDQHFAKPGKSPMGMDMVPKYAEAEGGAAGMALPQGAVQSLGVRVAAAEPGQLPGAVTAAGVIAFNDRDVAVVQPRAGGFVQRVYGRAPGDVILAGAPIAELLVPAWSGAQSEFLALARGGDPALVEAGRRRLALLGMSAADVAQVERSGRPAPSVTIRSPIGGVIQKLDVRAGMTVAMGQSLAEVNGLSSVWLNASVPEAQIAGIRVGQPVTADITAYPGETFAGRVTAILPAVQADSRTLQVRVELPNRGGRLHPGLFAAVHFGAAARPAVLVPSEAVIRTGRRNLVMLSLAGGRYQPAEVRTGREAGGRTEILAGLAPGERVVVSGQFLLDSEANLSGLTVRPMEGGTPNSDGGAR